MNSQVCVDASLIIWSLLPFPLSGQAKRLLNGWQNTETILIAPALLAFEVTASLRRLVYLKEITPAEGEEAFIRFRSIKVRLSHRQSIFPLAWDLARQFNRPRAYDTAYLALAQLNQCEFWTADERLYNAVKEKLNWVRWVGELPSDAPKNYG
jgi:predicted nucleic acid-binding protein